MKITNGTDYKVYITGKSILNKMEILARESVPLMFVICCSIREAVNIGMFILKLPGGVNVLL